MAFYFKNKYLYCEKLRVKDVQDRIPESPFYLYSLDQIAGSYKAYASALEGTDSVVSFAVKANSNLTILKHLRRLGSGATVVSGNELRLALAAGFHPGRTIFNGNGKTVPELVLAAGHGVTINIDSEFDLEHIEQAAGEVGRPVNVLIRINPDIDPDVHRYMATGVKDSKFGVGSDRFSWFLGRIKKSTLLNLLGVHCHLGSAIGSVDVFREAARLMARHIEAIRRDGFEAGHVNVGGGLDVDFEKKKGLPEPSDIIDAVREVLPADVTLIVEPGRSIVASAGVLVCRVIGTKENGDRHFIVTDGSMTELIRPSLYGAHHHIDFIEPVAGAAKTYHVVGPVCESADFLGRDRELPTPGRGVGLAVFDAGAYGYVMASNYNARMRPPEYLVDGSALTRIRRAESFEDYMSRF